MIKEAIYEIVNGNDLSYEMAEQVMDEIMSGEASQIHMGAFLTGLRMKGETIDEITACAAGMRKHCTRLLHDMDVLEIVGTGGAEVGTFNISTISSMVVSAAGIPVAKHGNRSVSANAGRQMCWKRLARTSRSALRKARRSWMRSASASSLPRRITRPCGL